MEMYIGKNKFHFITDYSKHIVKNTNGEDIILDFGLLTIEERIMLSSYLTVLCNKKELTGQNLYEIIFNFNSKKQRQTSYHNSFIEDLTSLLKNKPHYFTFIKDNFDKIENNKTFIYRQQLNASEMQVLYSLKFQRNYSSLMNVLYIIGVSKQNITTAALNHISLKRIYHSASPSVAKKRTIEIFNKLNKVSKKEIKYKFEDKEVFFGNGFSIEEDERFYSYEKKDFNKNQKLEDWLNSLEEENKIKIEQPVALNKKGEIVDLPKKENIEVEIDEDLYEEVKEQTPIKNQDIFNLGDEHLKKETIKDFWKKYSQKITNYAAEKVCLITTTNQRKIEQKVRNVVDQLVSNKDVRELVDTGFIKGEDWKQKRSKAFSIINQIQNKLIKEIEFVYDNNKDDYKTILFWVLITYHKYFEIQEK